MVRTQIPEGRPINAHRLPENHMCGTVDETQQMDQRHENETLTGNQQKVSQIGHPGLDSDASHRV